VAAYTAETNYPDSVLADKPVGYWRLNGRASESVANQGVGGVALDGQTVGKVEMQQKGPSSEQFPDFKVLAQAATFHGDGAHIRIKEKAGENRLQFKNGDAITLEAWVDLKHIGDGQNMYVL